MQVFIRNGIIVDKHIVSLGNDFFHVGSSDRGSLSAATRSERVLERLHLKQSLSLRDAFVESLFDKIKREFFISE